MRLATARLSISKAGGHSTVKDRLQQRLGRVIVDAFIVATLVKRVIETELLILQVLGQIHLATKTKNTEILK